MDSISIQFKPYFKFANNLQPPPQWLQFIGMYFRLSFFPSIYGLRMEKALEKCFFHLFKLFWNQSLYLNNNDILIIKPFHSLLLSFWFTFFFYIQSFKYLVWLSSKMIQLWNDYLHKDTISNVLIQSISPYFCF